MSFGRLTQRPKPNESVLTPTSSDPSSPASELSENSSVALLRLPPELLHQILSHLPFQSLVCLIRTCRCLRHHAENDILWAALLRHNIPQSDFPENPYPAPSYRSLYVSHHPYWFLPRNVLFFSDDPYNGNLMLVRFDPRRGCIEGYRLLADKGTQWLMPWSYHPAVTIHSFTPSIKLWIDHPILKLPYDASAFSTRQGWWDGEIKMAVGIGAGTLNTSVSASFFLTRDISVAQQSSQMKLWPPLTIAGDMPRVRAESQDKFRGPAHKPQKYDEISETSFRMRIWSQFTVETARFGIRLGEEVATWSTLPKQLYAPTKLKPYQGIFVGDYAGHGCEFLLVLQTEKAPELPVRREGVTVFGEIIGRSPSDLDSSEQAVTVNGERSESGPGTVGQNTNDILEDEVFRGALEAIKLTGDVNIPRGQHTFIADDIGPGGFIRIADEKPFRGARIVKSRGHVALRGFQDDAYVPSQLIMISPDLLAQFWVNMGHISYYRRVDIGDLMAQTFRDAV